MRINGSFVVPPTLNEVFEQQADDIGSKLRVCVVGTIFAYDSTKRTASILISENLVLNDGTIMPIVAPIVDVPVLTMQGGGLHVGFPVKPGDECIVIFNDFNIDAWHANGGQQTPNDARQHDISDGFAIVGPNSLANPILTALGPTEGGLATATSKVAVDSFTGLVTIKVAGVALATVLVTLLTALQTFLSTAAADAGLILVAPTTATAAGVAATAVGTAITAIEAILY